MGKTGTLMHSWWECEMVQPQWKAMWWFLKTSKKKKKNYIGPSNPISGNAYKRIQKRTSKRYRHTHAHCSTIYNSQEVGATLMPKDRGKNEENAIDNTQWNTMQPLKRMKPYHSLQRG